MIKKQLINLEPVREQVRTKLMEKYDNTTYMNTSIIDVKLDVKELLEQYITEQNITEPTIYMATEAYVKMRKLVDDTATEIGWYGTVTRVPGLEQTFVIEDILVYPQRVTGATCEQDDNRMFEFELSLTTEQVNTKRFHGHSHVNMGVTPSGVDENFYQDILTQVNDFFIVVITNKRNEYTVRFYDVEHNILYTDVPIKVIANNGTTIDDWYADADAMLIKPTPVAVPKGYGKPYDHKRIAKEDEDFLKSFQLDSGYYEHEDIIEENRIFKSSKKKGR